MIFENLAVIGRPEIGGEYLCLLTAKAGHSRLHRYKQISETQSEEQALHVSAVRNQTMADDLLDLLETVIDAGDVDLDRGPKPTIRQRLTQLASL